MAIITIFSESYCRGEEVVVGLAEKLRLQRFEKQLLTETSEEYSVSHEKLQRTLQGAIPKLNKFTREREKNTAYLRATIAELVQQDNLLYHGFAGLLLPRNITHILRVLLIANLDFRVKLVHNETGKSHKEARKIILKEDKDLLQWTRFIADKEHWDKTLYDLVIPIHDTSVEAAINEIEENLKKDALRTTKQSLQAVTDNILSSKVNIALVEKGHDVDVISEDGNILIIINKYTMRLEQHEEELKAIAKTIEGVKNIETRVGSKYNAPSIYPIGEFEMPPKILLVDDEKEFVHTLSERLQTRNLDSAVVYDGEEALAFIESEEPEVMVLDLKMPGIDGIEVLRRVKRTHPNVEVIILTGHGSDKEKQIAADLGAYAYLQKPIDIDLLAQTMREAYQRVAETKAGLKRER